MKKIILLISIVICFAYAISEQVVAAQNPNAHKGARPGAHPQARRPGAHPQTGRPGAQDDKVSTDPAAALEAAKKAVAKAAEKLKTARANKNQSAINKAKDEDVKAHAVLRKARAAVQAAKMAATPMVAAPMAAAPMAAVPMAAVPMVAAPMAAVPMVAVPMAAAPMVTPMVAASMAAPTVMTAATNQIAGVSQDVLRQLIAKEVAEALARERKSSDSVYGGTTAAAPAASAAAPVAVATSVTPAVSVIPVSATGTPAR